MEIERIVVGIDGSDGARLATEWAVGLSRAFGAEIIAVSALGILAHVDGEEVPAQGHRDAVRRMFESSWCAPLRTAGISYRTELRDGSPVPVLLDIARELDADVIVVGSRGLGGFPNLLLGSTSTQVAQHSTRPVVIVPGAG